MEPLESFSLKPYIKLEDAFLDFVNLDFVNEYSRPTKPVFFYINDRKYLEITYIQSKAASIGEIEKYCLDKFELIKPQILNFVEQLKAGKTTSLKNLPKVPKSKKKIKNKIIKQEQINEIIYYFLNDTHNAKEKLIHPTEKSSKKSMIDLRNFVKSLKPQTATYLENLINFIEPLKNIKRESLYHLIKFTNCTLSTIYYYKKFNMLAQTELSSHTKKTDGVSHSIQYQFESAKALSFSFPKPRKKVVWKENINPSKSMQSKKISKQSAPLFKNYLDHSSESSKTSGTEVSLVLSDEMLSSSDSFS